MRQADANATPTTATAATTANLFRNNTDKFIAAVITISALLTIYGFFGLTGFAVIGTVIAIVAFVAFLCWVNYLTGGALGFLLFFWSL